VSEDEARKDARAHETMRKRFMDGLLNQLRWRRFRWWFLIGCVVGLVAR
jgi:hypothetical protein